MLIFSGTVLDTKDSIELDEEMKKALDDTLDFIAETQFHLKSPNYVVHEDVKKV